MRKSSLKLAQIHFHAFFSTEEIKCFDINLKGKTALQM